MLCFGLLAAVHAVNGLNVGRSPDVVAANVWMATNVHVSALTDREGTRVRR